MQMNFRDVAASELDDILDSLKTMGYVQEIFTADGKAWYTYVVNQLPEETTHDPVAKT